MKERDKYTGFYEFKIMVLEMLFDELKKRGFDVRKHYFLSYYENFKMSDLRDFWIISHDLYFSINSLMYDNPCMFIVVAQEHIKSSFRDINKFYTTGDYLYNDHSVTEYLVQDFISAYNSLYLVKAPVMELNTSNVGYEQMSIFDFI